MNIELGQHLLKQHSFQSRFCNLLQLPIGGSWPGTRLPSTWNLFKEGTGPALRLNVFLATILYAGTENLWKPVKCKSKTLRSLYNSGEIADCFPTKICQKLHFSMVYSLALCLTSTFNMSQSFSCPRMTTDCLDERLGPHPHPLLCPPKLSLLFPLS